MKGYLLDVNVLIALAWPNHLNHAAAHEWFNRESPNGWGTCMVTQIGFVRVSSHPAFDQHVSTQHAWQKLLEIAALPGHSFWPEPAEGCSNPTFLQTLPNMLTHGIVTDGYLATVAASNGGKLATSDRQLVRTYPQIAVLVGSAS